MTFAVLCHYLSLHVLEVKICLKGGLSLVKLLGQIMKQTFLAMHEFGCFNQKYLEEIFGQVFSHYKSAELMTYFGDEEKCNNTLMLICKGLPESRLHLVKKTIDKHIVAMR